MPYVSCRQRKFPAAPRSTTRTGAADSPSSSAMAGRSARTPSRTRCSFWPRTATAASRMIAAAMAARASPGTATTWTPTPTTSRRWSQQLDLKDAIHVGHSTGGGEVARYIGRHGTKRVAKAVLIGAIPPLMLKTRGQSRRHCRSRCSTSSAPASLADRSQFWKDLSMPFYGYNRPGAKISEGVRDSFWLQGMMAGFPASYFCIKAFSETDLTEDLKKFDVPTLILHGDDDQIVPIGASAHAVVQDRQGRDAEGLQGRAARHVHDAQGPGQRGPARVLQGLSDRAQKVMRTENENR